MGSIQGITTADKWSASYGGTNYGNNPIMAGYHQLVFEYSFGDIIWGDSQQTTKRKFTFKLGYTLQYNWSFNCNWYLKISTSYDTLYERSTTNPKIEGTSTTIYMQLNDDGDTELTVEVPFKSDGDYPYIYINAYCNSQNRVLQQNTGYYYDIKASISNFKIPDSADSFAQYGIIKFIIDDDSVNCDGHFKNESGWYQGNVHFVPNTNNEVVLMARGSLVWYEIVPDTDYLYNGQTTTVTDNNQGSPFNPSSYCLLNQGGYYSGNNYIAYMKYVHHTYGTWSLKPQLKLNKVKDIINNAYLAKEQNSQIESISFKVEDQPYVVGTASHQGVGTSTFYVKKENNTLYQKSFSGTGSSLNGQFPYNLERQGFQPNQCYALTFTTVNTAGNDYNADPISKTIYTYFKPSITNTTNIPPTINGDTGFTISYTTTTPNSSENGTLQNSVTLTAFYKNNGDSSWTTGNTISYNNTTTPLNLIGTLFELNKINQYAQVGFKYTITSKNASVTDDNGYIAQDESDYITVTFKPVLRNLSITGTTNSYIDRYGVFSQQKSFNYTKESGVLNKFKCEYYKKLDNIKTLINTSYINVNYITLPSIPNSKISSGDAVGVTLTPLYEVSLNTYIEGAPTEDIDVYKFGGIDTLTINYPKNGVTSANEFTKNINITSYPNFRIYGTFENDVVKDVNNVISQGAAVQEKKFIAIPNISNTGTTSITIIKQAPNDGEWYQGCGEYKININYTKVPLSSVPTDYNQDEEINVYTDIGTSIQLNSYINAILKSYAGITTSLIFPKKGDKITAAWFETIFVNYINTIVTTINNSYTNGMFKNVKLQQVYDTDITTYIGQDKEILNGEHSPFYLAAKALESIYRFDNSIELLSNGDSTLTLDSSINPHIVESTVPSDSSGSGSLSVSTAADSTVMTVVHPTIETNEELSINGDVEASSYNIKNLPSTDNASFTVESETFPETFTNFYIGNLLDSAELTLNSQLTPHIISEHPNIGGSTGEGNITTFSTAFAEIE